MKTLPEGRDEPPTWPVQPEATEAAFDAVAHTDEFADVARRVDDLTKRIPRQTTVIGNGVDTEFFIQMIEGTGETGYNVLRLPEDGIGKRYGIGLNNRVRWSQKVNIKWLDGAIRRGDEIHLATNPDKIVANPFFQMELDYLKSKGYVQQGLYMVKK